MKAKYARLIRIGIMSRCIPYKANKKPDPVYGGFYEVIDFARLDEISTNWGNNNHLPLVRKAAERTKPWTSVRYVDED